MLCMSVAWMQLVSNAHAHITLILLICYSTFLFFYFRSITYDGDSYTGGYKQGRANGKGEEEWANGSREIAYFVNGKKEGAAKYYDKNGNEQDRFYKDDKLVEQ